VHRVGLPWLRLAGGGLVLLLLGQQVGAGPFREGLRAVTWPLVLAAVALTAMTTVCSAWRWRVVAQALGVKLALPAAVGAYYRSQFLNSVLPGAVLGDVHRAVAHGRHAGDLARGLRAVGYERLFGQVVQALVTAVVLLILPSPVRPALPYLIVGGVWPQLTLASVLIVAGHTTTFVLAARAAGSTAPLGELVALLMLVQTAMVIPFSVGGWAPPPGLSPPLGLARPQGLRSPPCTRSSPWWRSPPVWACCFMT
jgi:uncharacterized membrane protein YbhN (UPF0104 family)